MVQDREADHKEELKPVEYEYTFQVGSGDVWKRINSKLCVDILQDEKLSIKYH